MPELPEVEIERENLERWLVGKRIVGARAPDGRIRGFQPRAKVERALEGARVKAVSRRGKFLLLDLGRKRPSIVAHLGMTGKFVRLGRGDEAPRFVRVELRLPRGDAVVFSDARRLGQFRLLDGRESERLRALGPEPLGPELTPAVFHRLLQRSARPIKLLLMDQQKIAGIGNIHAAEALFRARIHPKRAASSLDREEAGRLVRSVRRALVEEIRRFRSESPTYFHEGPDNEFLVYGREAEPCPRCRRPIERFVQGGRSSYYCPSCQPERLRR